MPAPKRWDADQEQWVTVRSLYTRPSENWYYHVQDVLSDSWTVKHKLGRHPVVHVEDVSGNVVYGDIQHRNNDVITITFAVPFSGTAFCN